MQKEVMNDKKVATFFFLTALLIIPLLILPAMAATEGGGNGALEVYCGSRCRGRCGKTGLKERCLKYCGICCRECKCVPSGTFGNKHQCPCYRDKLSSQGKPKCP